MLFSYYIVCLLKGNLYIRFKLELALPFMASICRISNKLVDLTKLGV